MLPDVISDNSVIGQRSLTQGVGVFLSSDLTLRTQEGDVVSLSFDGQRSLLESRSETLVENVGTFQEFSSVAVAASRYSISVQGDLNEDELAAIRNLASIVAPIARDFFTGAEFSVEAAVERLAGSLGVIQEVELALERTVVQTVSAESFTRIPPGQESLPEPAASAENVPAVDVSNIRDLPALVSATVETEFMAQAEAFVENEFILQTLKDLMELLQKRLVEFLDPLNHSHTDSENPSDDAEQGPSSEISEE